MIAVSDFRAIFPEFASTTVYPDAGVTFWIAQGYQILTSCPFGTQLDLAVALFVAHNIVLSARAAAQAALPGGVVGTAAGIAASKSVGPASISYDTNLTSSRDAGFWNATSYGQRFWMMIRAFGTGPLYITRQVPGWPVYPDVGYAVTARNDGF